MIADDFDGFLIDLDGVIYVGETLIARADDAIRALRALGKHVLFLTNDTRSSQEELAAKLQALGVGAHASEILTSGAATAANMAQARTAGRSAFVIGSRALKQVVRSAGFEVIEGEQGRSADFVVVGAHDAFDYAELRIASQAVRRGAAFYATGKDPTFPMPDGPWPATGAILAAVESASGRHAQVVGKPEPGMFRVAQELLPGCERYVVIGDRLDSDIAGGRRAGLATVLVLTGATSESEAMTASPSPDFIINDLMSLITGDGKTHSS